VSTKSHLNVWIDFANTHSGCRDKLIVFQYDAALGRADAGSIVAQYVRNKMTEDFTYLGYCFHSFGIPKFLKKKRYNKYHPKVTGAVPHCLYAYAVSLPAVKRLLRLVQPCGDPLDVQIAKLVSAGKLSYKYLNDTYDPAFVLSEFAAHGVDWRDDSVGSDANRDGLFPQVVLDEVLPPLPDGTVAHDQSRERYIFALYKQTWRHVANMDMYHKILGEAAGVKGSVMVLTAWQFQHYPEGDVLTDAEVEELVRLRSSLQL
jgi:hypothetical protein